MSNHYEVIDESKWKRRIHCMVFKNSIEPCYCVSLELDVTKFHQWVKSKNYSFTIAMIYMVAEAANQIEEFRYRFVDDKVVLFDRLDTSFTYLNQETELFKVVSAPMRDTIDDYVMETTKLAREQKAYFTGPLAPDVYQFSPLPWITYTHISHTISGKVQNGMQTFDWGKYFERDGKLVLPFSVQAHHSFVDGIHVSKFVELLQENLLNINLQEEKRCEFY